jgi:hypothetical protein
MLAGPEVSLVGDQTFFPFSTFSIAIYVNKGELAPVVRVRVSSHTSEARRYVHPLPRT